MKKFEEEEREEKKYENIMEAFDACDWRKLDTMGIDFNAPSRLYKNISIIEEMWENVTKFQTTFTGIQHPDD